MTEALDAASGLDYTRVLADARRDPVVTSINVVTGFVAALLAFVGVNQGVQLLIDALGWRARGKPVSFTDFVAAASAFRYPEGLLAANLGLAAMIVVVLLAVRFVHRVHPVWASSVQPGLRWRYLLIVFVVAAVVVNAMYWPTIGRTDFVWKPPADVWVWLAIIVLTSPLQAAGEEYLFRGYLPQVIGIGVRQKWAIVPVAGAVFAAVHGTQNPAMVADRFAFGCVMGALVVLTGGLEAAIAIHAANNVFTFGYAALSSRVADARAMTDVSWGVAATSIAAYLVIAAAAWFIARRMKLATLS